MAIKAIIFDFDGTMLDTETAIYESWREIYASYDQSLPVEVWAEVIGSASLTFDPFDRLEQLIDKTLDRTSVNEKRRAMERRLIEDRELQPGVRSLMTEAKQRGIKLAVASNSHISWVADHMVRLGLIWDFDTIVTRDQVKRGKPDPLIYTTAAERLGITPQEAVAIEDSPIGARAAVDSGMPTIIVPIGMTKGLDFPPADLTVETLADITIDNLLALG